MKKLPKTKYKWDIPKLRKLALAVKREDDKAKREELKELFLQTLILGLILWKTRGVRKLFKKAEELLDDTIWGDTEIGVEGRPAFTFDEKLKHAADKVKKIIEEDRE